MGTNSRQCQKSPAPGKGPFLPLARSTTQQRLQSLNHHFFLQRDPHTDCDCVCALLAGCVILLPWPERLVEQWVCCCLRLRLRVQARPCSRGWKEEEKEKRRRRRRKEGVARFLPIFLSLRLSGVSRKKMLSEEKCAKRESSSTCGYSKATETKAFFKRKSCAVERRHCLYCAKFIPPLVFFPWAYCLTRRWQFVLWIELEDLQKFRRILVKSRPQHFLPLFTQSRGKKKDCKMEREKVWPRNGAGIRERQSLWGRILDPRKTLGIGERRKNVILPSQP